MLVVGFVGGYQLRQHTEEPQPIYVAECKIQLFFSPKGGCTAKIIKTIEKATHTIEGSIYCFTSKSIANALIAAHKRGVQVRIVADRSQQNVKNGKLAWLHQHNIPIRMASGVKIMHKKGLLVDDKFTLAGSFNWTDAAEYKNAEFLMYIESEGISKRFQKDWNKYWKKGKMYIPKSSKSKR